MQVFGANAAASICVSIKKRFNVMNEMYARDISRKVRSSHRLRGNAGEPLSQPP